MYSSATKLKRVLSSGEIRKTFIDYFTVQHDHKFVRSSPVVPFCDPTVAFVNAGMNQFKSVFLGKTAPPYKRVANSQKCVRVGGKHNDLSVVGQDGYHHTFFEMLGNWSFGDYFKREACAMALELLRGPYSIDTSRLYVTYFGGDRALGLPADLECFEIWRSLGFSVERIIPFGSADNFWEMGSTGPCGPCTEIHIDHRPDLGSIAERAKIVNAGRADLTELWNLVFIQYNRNVDGSITKLPNHHVDTGMGFERLTAILQNKSSNYDTDLFMPLFEAIRKIAKVPQYNGKFATANDMALLDTGYRILADHCRMITICLADGMLPDQNQKLRRVMRKAFLICENTFLNEHLLQQLVPVVMDTLGAAYPEIINKQQAILELISHEQEIFKALRHSSAKAFAEVLTEFPNLEDVDLMECPGFVPAYREFQVQRSNFKNNVIPGKFLHKLGDTYGLTEENFQKLAELENMSCDMKAFRDELFNAKLKTKVATSASNKHVVEYTWSLEKEEVLKDLTAKLAATNNNFKYEYTYDAESKKYNVPSVQTHITGLMLNDEIVQKVDVTHLNAYKQVLCLVTDSSNFYYESGGQQADVGEVIVKDSLGGSYKFPIIGVKFMNDCVVHLVEIERCNRELQLTIADSVELKVNADKRKMNICHHTATHLLNAAIRSLFNKVTYQVSSSVSNDSCKLEVGIIGKRIDKDDVEAIEDLIGHIICAAIPLDIQLINASDVLEQNDITMVPGEIYPETGLRLITINGSHLGMISKELCCGTHVNNTQEIEYFCITNLKQTNRARFAFTAVAGSVAEQVLKTAALIRHRVDTLEQQYKSDKLTNATEQELQKIRNNILHSDVVLPYAFKVDTLERISDILKKLKETTRTTLKEFVEVEMTNVLHERPAQTHPFILHYMSSSALMEEVPLQKATKLCNDRPILVIGMCNGVVKARCCVPKNLANAKFNAESWLQKVAAVFKSQVSAPKGQNAHEVCNMKGKKVSSKFEEQLEIALKCGKDFATKFL